MKIGPIIKKYRTLKRLPQGKLATNLEITQNYLSMIELGKKNPSPEIITKFSEISGISANAIAIITSDVPVELREDEKTAFCQLQKTLEAVLFS